MGSREAQLPENYTPENFRAWTDRSRANLGVDTLDLVQLHCPPSEVIDADATYDALDALVADGSIAAYGVSVETCAQALVGHRAARRREHPDHPEPVPAEAARRGAAGRRGRRGRHPRPRAARVRAALRPVHRRHDVRGGRPPQLQPPRRGVRPRRDVLGGRLRGRASRRRASSPRPCPRASRCRPRRSRGWRRDPA